MKIALIVLMVSLGLNALFMAIIGFMYKGGKKTQERFITWQEAVLRLRGDVGQRENIIENLKKALVVSKQRIQSLEHDISEESNNLSDEELIEDIEAMLEES